MNFSGSYHPDQVELLVKLLSLNDFYSIDEKEKLIQSGKKHYSEMLSLEKLPSDEYMGIFNNALLLNSLTMAKDCLRLANHLSVSRPNGSITLVSLLRAGTPVGVIVKHILESVFGRTVKHFSISIFRDRGIDENALNYILRHHTADSIAFLDGWTGKGVISGVLSESIAKYNKQHQVNIDSGLYVVADLAGKAKYAASAQDYLIPSCILNATVSGLVSRTIANDLIQADDFHGCVYYDNYHSHDVSKHFVDVITQAALQEFSAAGVPAEQVTDKAELNAISELALATIMKLYSLSDRNLVKPGIGEATRVLLRRVPKVLILRDVHSVNVAHLVNLAQQKSVPIDIIKTIPYQAISIIGSSLDG